MARFDYNVIVIGAGSGGLVSAYIGASVKAKVLLIEKSLMGGDCLNTGCIPSKTLIKSAKYAHVLTKGDHYGFNNVSGDVDFSAVMSRVRNAIKTIEPNDSVERYTSLGVDCEIGEAHVKDAHTVEVNGKSFTTRNIIVASGGSPFIPPINGLDGVDYLTSDTIWDLNELPKHLTVIGGGPIGCELSQAFARLGSSVTQFEMAQRVLGREDEEISKLVEQSFNQDGITSLTSAQVISVSKSNGRIEVRYKQGSDTSEKSLTTDALLIAVGRKANVEGFGLEELGIELNPNKTIAIDSFLRTNTKSVYAVGEAAGPYQFTHFASHQAWYAAINSLFGPIRFKADYRVIPRVTFTDPEIATVGINELEATEKGVPYEVSRFDYAHSDRAISEGATTGWVKVLTKPRSDKIIGVTIVGVSAGEIIGEMVLAMKHGLGLNKILGTIHAYPTYIEMNKSVAGNWRKAHRPDFILALVEKWHAFRRR